MTSDVCVLISPHELRPGETVEFATDYDALVRAVDLAVRHGTRRLAAAAHHPKET